MTATSSPCLPDTDRFLRSVSVPDPPAGPFARQRYWDDTVQEAVGELRRRLASTRDEVVTLALLTIIKVETARMRHGRPVSGTQVSNVREWDDLPKLGPLEEATLRSSEAEASATDKPQPVADPPGSDQTMAEPAISIVAEPPGWPTPAGSRSESLSERATHPSKPAPSPEEAANNEPPVRIPDTDDPSHWSPSG